MAIVQISRITQRKGLAQDLPQLAGAEFGWSVDTRQLWIGNGTLEEGAPVIGNTEILTEFSNIIPRFQSYTYSGEAATGYAVQTGPSAGDPIKVTLQNWMDQWASVKDFGAVGDGATDDTDAINRALYQLYCRELNPSIRRSLYFPAGVYLVSSSIIIPPYATLYGEGPQGSAIVGIDGIGDYVIRTGDSLQQYGPNIGNNGASAPQSITIYNMAIKSLDATNDLVLLQDCSQVVFTETDFVGPMTKTDLTSDANDTACIRFSSTPSLITQQVTFNNCNFNGTVFGVNTNDQVKSVTFLNSNFDTLYQGIVLGQGTVVSGGPTGFAITGCDFDNIYSQGIVFGDVILNASAQNVFYDVGNYFGGVLQPQTTVFEILNYNNISVGDMFARSADYADVFPRINLNNTASIAFTSAEQLAMGSYVRRTGQTTTLLDDQSSPQTIFTVNTDEFKAFTINYTMKRLTSGSNGFRTGILAVVSDSGVSDLTYTDDFNQNIDVGVTLSVTQSSNTVSVKYTSTLTGDNINFTYSLTHLA